MNKRKKKDLDDSPIKALHCFINEHHCFPVQTFGKDKGKNSAVFNKPAWTSKTKGASNHLSHLESSLLTPAADSLHVSAETTQAWKIKKRFNWLVEKMFWKHYCCIITATYNTHTIKLDTISTNKSHLRTFLFHRVPSKGYKLLKKRHHLHLQEPSPLNSRPFLVTCG